MIAANRKAKRRCQEIASHPEGNLPWAVLKYPSPGGMVRIETTPETHKDHKRVLELNRRSLTLIGIPEGLCISEGTIRGKTSCTELETSEANPTLSSASIRHAA
jgi:hypothetical protein